MIRILLAEWIKIRTYKPVWVLSLIVAGIYILAIMALNALTDQFQETFPLGQSTMTWTPYVWVARWSLVLLGFSIIQVVCNEREFRTDRQNLIDGLSRPQYFLAKLSNTLIPIVVMIPLVCAMKAWVQFDRFHLSAAYEPLLRFSLCALGYGALAMLCGLVFRRSTQATFCFVAYPSIIEPFVGFFVSSQTGYKVGDYLPFSIFNDLVISPFSAVEAQLGLQSVDSHLLWPLAGAYLFGLWALSFVLIMRRNF